MAPAVAVAVRIKPGGDLIVPWVANNQLEISKFKFNFPRARTYEMIGLVLGCIEAKFCK